MVKKLRPFFGLLFFVIVSLAGTLLVFFSTNASLILPLFWAVFSLMRLVNKKNDKILYLWNCSRTAMAVFFLTQIFFFFYTPLWIESLSLYLERYSFYKMYAHGSYMYGRIFVAFILAMSVLPIFYIVYKFRHKKDAV